MRFGRPHAREEPEINLIPLIDILIVVLIFLFLTTTYNRFAELQINLPEAAAQKSPDRPQVLAVAGHRHRRGDRRSDGILARSAAD